MAECAPDRSHEPWFPFRGPEGRSRSQPGFNNGSGSGAKLLLRPTCATGHNYGRKQERKRRRET